MKKLVFFCVCCLILSSMLNGAKLFPFANGRSYPWTNASLRSVFMLNASNLWTVGQSGAILRWEGLSWRTVTSPTDSWLQSVYMNNETDGWAVGSSGAIIHWNGSFWETVPSPTGENLYDVFMANPNDGWAVGWDGNTIHWNGTTWSAISSPTTWLLFSVYMVDSSDVWAVGSSGTIINWNGTAWNTVVCPTTSSLQDVFMVTASDGWGVGSGGTIIHYNGTSWNNVSSPTTNGLRSVFILNSTEGWAVGDAGTVIRWNGTTWNSVASPITGWFFSVFMIDENDGWAVGDFGSIIHWNGVEWLESSTSIYQGDLIISGDDVFVIEDERFDINGSIIVEENATLILRNAIVNFTQVENYQFNMTFRNPVNGNPRLQVENATITTSNYYFHVRFYANSTVTAYKLETSDRIRLWAYDSTIISANLSTMYSLWTYGSTVISIDRSTMSGLYGWDSSVVDVSNSTFSLLSGADSSTVTVSNCTISEYLRVGESSFVNISNSTIRELRPVVTSVECLVFGLTPRFFSFWNFSLDCSVIIAPSGEAPEVTLKDSTIQDWAFYFLAFSNATIFDSDLLRIETWDNSNIQINDSAIHWLNSKHDSRLGLTNATIYLYNVQDQSEVYISWYLSVHVIDSIGQNIPSANTTAIYPNATVAETKLTDSDGLTKLTLIKKMMNATDSYPIGNYTVEATYGIYSDDTTVNMTENKQITLTLEDFRIPEFPSLLILPLFMTITLLAVIVYKKHNGREVTKSTHIDNVPRKLKRIFDKTRIAVLD